MKDTSEFPQTNNFVPEELIGYLYDVLQQSRKDYVLDDFHIYIITQILNEQIRRKLVTTSTKNGNKFVIQDKQ